MSKQELNMATELPPTGEVRLVIKIISGRYYVEFGHKYLIAEAGVDVKLFISTEITNLLIELEREEKE